MPSLLETLLLAYARHFPMRKGKLRVVNGFWRIAAGPDPHRTARLIYGGMKMPCDLREMLQRQFYFFGTYLTEKDIIACWQRVCRNAKVVLDVGANAGIYSLAAVAAQRDVAVHAFEPTSEIAARLRRIVEMNGLSGVHVHEAAVSDRTGHASLVRFRGDSGSNEGMNFISRDSDQAAAEQISTIRLDDFFKTHGLSHIDAMKIDIQGHEPAALAGALAFLEAGKIGAIFIELNWGAEGESCAATESVRLLDGAGYLFSAPRRRLQWRKAGPWLRGMDDVVARRPGQG